MTTKIISNGRASALAVGDELEVPEAVMPLIGQVCSASQQFPLLAQRLIGLIEGRGMPASTPIQLVVTAAKLVVGEEAGVAPV